MTGMMASFFGPRAAVPAAVSTASAAEADDALFGLEPLPLPCCVRGLPLEAAAGLECCAPRAPVAAVVLPPGPAEADPPTDAPDSRRVRGAAAPVAGDDGTGLSRLVRLTPATPTLGALVRAVLRVSAADAGLGEARFFSAVCCTRPEAAVIRPAGGARGDAVARASFRDGCELLPPAAGLCTALAANWGVAAACAASTGSDVATNSTAVAFFGSDGAGVASTLAAFGEAPGVGSRPCCASIPGPSLVAGSAPLLEGRPDPVLAAPSR
jgi:hypothetical protein